MRKILFRGLDKRYNKAAGHEYNVWRFGSLIEYDNGQAAIVANADRYGHGMFTNEVIPETVSQYTGLDDKNGVKIFEGDVMHWDSHWGWYVGYENGAFRRIPLNDIQRINWRHHTLQQEGLDTWEIIGNIHEEVTE